MKRALIATSAAVLLSLAGCAGGDDAVTAQSAPSPSSSQTTTPTSTVAETNAQVREACRAAVTEKLPGADFATRGTLRAASSEGGRLFTVSGTAQADGTAHPYTCSVTQLGEEITVDQVLVDGQ
ncbi:MAG: hypothetical protein ACLGIV_12075 [Actinomycetes bacterium]